MLITGPNLIFAIPAVAPESPDGHLLNIMTKSSKSESQHTSSGHLINRLRPDSMKVLSPDAAAADAEDSAIAGADLYLRWLWLMKIWGWRSDRCKVAQY